MNTINDNFEIQYIPARICEGSDITIKYYAYDPTTQKLKRVVNRYNHLRGKMNKTQLLRHLRAIANDINVNLAAGKNPFIEAATPKSYHQLADAIKLFLKLKERDMRPDGHRSYTSYCKKINEWLIAKDMKGCFVVSFTRDMALEYMNELALNEKLSNRTWNNSFVFYRSLWNWLIQNNYCVNNIFEGFDKKRELPKIRQIVDAETHTKIVEYCHQNKPELEIVIDLVRAAFMRPKEISLIQIKDIDLERRVIRVSIEKSKTHRARFAYLPDWLCVKISNHYQLSRFPMDHYLIASSLRPGTVHIDTRTIDKYWTKMRNVLKLGMDMQLYSYRDTGINALEDSGVPRRVIQKLTDHTTEKMVGKYIHQPSQDIINNVVCLIKE